MATLNFKGKPFVQNMHLGVQYHQLLPVPKKSLSDQPSLNDNLIIHGDNLKALKSLLPMYAGKVKCVYIDPPYNTGKEGWVYNDNVTSPMMKDWLGKVVDREDLTRHDKWLCMMTPRLQLLRELLREDGVIFTSLDDNELQHFRSLMDEIFGEENWIGNVVWKNATDNNPTNIAIEHEYIVCYAKRKSNIVSEWKSKNSIVKNILIKIGDEFTKKFKKSDELNAAYQKWYSTNKAFLWPMDGYKFIDENGVYAGSRSVHNPGRQGYSYSVIHPKTKKVCSAPLLGYRFPKETMDKLLSEGKIIFGEDESKIIELKVYAKEFEDKLPSVISMDSRTGAYELREIFPETKKHFDHPKPVALIRQILDFVVNDGEVVLDPFAGSGTTAHAVLALNNTDEGKRRFILVECEDYTDKVTAERVRRVIKGIKDSKDETLKKGLGGSFTFCEIGPPFDIAHLLEGKNLPSYDALAQYVFHTATGATFDAGKMKPKEHYIGRSDRHDAYLWYVPDVQKLKDMAFTLDDAEALGKPKNGRRRLVFAPLKYVDQEDLDILSIDFVHLPYEIYERIP